MKILLVDDEDRSRVNLADFLSKLGHQVLECRSAAEALQVLPDSNIQLLLTDNRMPGMSGLELMRRARELPSCPGLNMIMFTAYGDMDSSIAALRAGAFDYLLKPLNIEELVKTLGRVEQKIADSVKESNAAKRDPDPNTYESRFPAADTFSIPLQSGRYGDMMIYSETMKNIMALSRKLHNNRNIPALIEGETGTGKEMIARYIHFGEEAVDTPFIAINCAAIPESLFESELFGYEGGSFSGSLARGSRGKVDLAQGGTLFLDEISEIPLNLQAKLLRLIQEKEFYRVGGLTLINSDIRIIGASNQNLQEAVNKGSFRQDLYYRLKVGQIYLPPLRDRREIILPLTGYFLEEFSRKNGKGFRGISQEAAGILTGYQWPGNIRELRNLIEWIVVSEDSDLLQSKHLAVITDCLAWHESKNLAQGLPSDFIPEGLPLNEISNVIIQRALIKHDGNKAATARYLGISRSALYKRLKIGEPN